jgi:hypothetical protein
LPTRWRAEGWEREQNECDRRPSIRLAEAGGRPVCSAIGQLTQMASAASEHRDEEQGHAHADLYDESRVRAAGRRSSQKSFAHKNSLLRRSRVRWDRLSTGPKSEPATSSSRMLKSANKHEVRCAHDGFSTFIADQDEFSSLQISSTFRPK